MRLNNSINYSKIKCPASSIILFCFLKPEFGQKEIIKINNNWILLLLFGFLIMNQLEISRKKHNK